jgi:hypothetical protein
MPIDPPRYQISIDSTRTNTVTNYGNTPSTLLETREGDFILGSEGDVLIANSKESAGQYAQYVVKTDKRITTLFVNLGSRLRDFVGRRNDYNTHDLISSYLTEDLENANIRYVENSVEVLPFKDNIILINFIIISSSNERIQQTYKFDIMSGAIEDIGGAQI